MPKFQTQAREMMEQLQDLSYLVGEEMTQHPMGNGQMQGFPSEYRGLAKVTRVKDGDVKSWFGMDMPIFVDVAKGETNLMTPGGQRATMDDVNRWFDLEVIDNHP
jgi:hypothetical protein